MLDSATAAKTKLAACARQRIDQRRRAGRSGARAPGEEDRQCGAQQQPANRFAERGDVAGEVAQLGRQPLHRFRQWPVHEQHQGQNRNGRNGGKPPGCRLGESRGDGAISRMRPHEASGAAMCHCCN
jgi:hypothetical protein